MPSIWPLGYVDGCIFQNLACVCDCSLEIILQILQIKIILYIYVYSNLKVRFRQMKIKLIITANNCVPTDCTFSAVRASKHASIERKLISIFNHRAICHHARPTFGRAEFDDVPNICAYGRRIPRY